MYLVLYVVLIETTSDVHIPKNERKMFLPKAPGASVVRVVVTDDEDARSAIVGPTMSVLLVGWELETQVLWLGPTRHVLPGWIVGAE